MRWQVLILPLVLCASAVLILLLFSWRLGTLTHGMNGPEIAARKSSSSLTEIKNNPINAPHKLGQLLFQKLGHKGAFWMRLVSVIAALVILTFLFLLLKEWFGVFIATLATLLFAAIPWVTLMGRSATPDIMLLLPIPVIASFVWLSKDKRWSDIAWLVLCIVVAISIYTPGLLWLVLISTLLASRSLVKSINRVSGPFFVLGLSIFLILLAPLGYGIYFHTSVAKDILLYPHSWQSLGETLKSILWGLSGLAFKMRHHVDYTIGNLPILSVSVLALSLFGIYAMYKGAKDKVYLFCALIVVGIILAGINNNPVLLTLCLPPIAIFVAAALRYLYIKWFKVFPLNPLPKALAVALMVLLISLQVAYGMRYSLMAWPHTVATKSTYVLK
jgi:hypothetical protein